MLFFTTLSDIFLNQSYLLADFIVALKNFEFRNNPSVEPKILQTKGEFPEFQESLSVTRKIFRQIREIAGSTSIMTFTSERSAFHEQFFQPIVEGQEMVFVPNVGKRVEEKNVKGATVRARDHHWGERGHQWVAELLAPEIKKLLSLK